MKFKRSVFVSKFWKQETQDFLLWDGSLVFRKCECGVWVGRDVLAAGRRLELHHLAKV